MGQNASLKINREATSPWDFLGSDSVPLPGQLSYHRGTRTHTKVWMPCRHIQQKIRRILQERFAQNMFAFFVKCSSHQIVRKCPTIPIPEVIKFLRKIFGKHLTLKETQPKCDAFCKCLALEQWVQKENLLVGEGRQEVTAAILFPVSHVVQSLGWVWQLLVQTLPTTPQQVYRVHWLRDLKRGIHGTWPKQHKIDSFSKMMPQRWRNLLLWMLKHQNNADDWCYFWNGASQTSKYR